MSLDDIRYNIFARIYATGKRNAVARNLHLFNAETWFDYVTDSKFRKIMSRSWCGEGWICSSSNVQDSRFGSYIFTETTLSTRSRESLSQELPLILFKHFEDKYSKWLVQFSTWNLVSFALHFDAICNPLRPISTFTVSRKRKCISKNDKNLAKSQKKKIKIKKSQKCTEN